MIPNETDSFRVARQLYHAITRNVKRKNPLWVQWSIQLVEEILLQKVMQLNLLDRLTNNDQDAFAELMATDEWQARIQQRLTVARQDEECSTAKYIHNHKGEKMYEADILRVTVWWVQMCGGSLETAQRALDVVKSSKGILS